MVGATYDYMMVSESDWFAARTQLAAEGVKNPTPAEVALRKEKISSERRLKS